MLEAADFIPHRVLAWDAEYLYAIRYEAETSYIYRLTSRTDMPASAIGSIPGELIRCMWASQDYIGTVLARTQDHIYKTVDGGAKWGNNAPNFDNGAPIFRLGGIGEPQLIGGGVSVLHRGVAWDGDNVYLAEYSLAPGRVAGGYNDAVRLLKSNDRGTSWAVAAEWNTNGTHYVRHLHSVQAHGGFLYIQTGDENYESGILRWDPTQPLASNQFLSTYSNCWSGSQRYRTGDILFPPGDYMYWMADSSVGDSTSPDRGIWRGRKDMTGEPERVDSQVLKNRKHSGWYGVIMPNGDLIFSEFLEPSAAGEPIFFYGSADGGSTWEMCASYGMALNGSGGADVFFVWAKDGVAYFTKPLHSGKAAISATVALNSRPYNVNEGVRIIHPVYWVAKSGEDATEQDKGLRPDRPWKSVEYALSGNRITYGSRVVVEKGRYVIKEPIVVDWGSNASPPKGFPLVTLDGGSNETTVFAMETRESLLNMTGNRVQMRNIWHEKTLTRESKSGEAIMVTPRI